MGDERAIPPDGALRILQVVEASFAGVGRHVLDLVEGLTSDGHAVDLVHGSERAERDFLERAARSGARRVVAVEMGRAPSPSDLSAWRALRGVIAEGGPYDVVHGHASKGGALARLAAPRSTARIYTPNALVTQSPGLSGAGRLVYGGVERILARRTDGLVYVSPEEESHGAELHLRPRSATVIPNGIPLVELPDQAAARAALGLDPHGVVLGFVGRLSAQKGLDRLIEAMVDIRGDDVVLAVIGDGEDAASLRAQAVDLGVADRVRWLGRQPGQASMPAFDVFVVPSRYEGFPYVVLEGLWAGLPVVATSSSGAQLVLGDGRTGIVVDGSPPSLASAIADLVADPELRADRCGQAREVVGEFTVAEMVRRTGEFYLHVLGRRKDSRA